MSANVIWDDPSGVALENREVRSPGLGELKILEDIEASLAEGTFRPGGVPIRGKGEEQTAAT